MVFLFELSPSKDVFWSWNLLAVGNDLSEWNEGLGQRFSGHLEFKDEFIVVDVAVKYHLRFQIRIVLSSWLRSNLRSESKDSLWEGFQRAGTGKKSYRYFPPSIILACGPGNKISLKMHNFGYRFALLKAIFVLSCQNTKELFKNSLRKKGTKNCNMRFASLLIFFQASSNYMHPPLTPSHWLPSLVVSFE